MAAWHRSNVEVNGAPMRVAEARTGPLVLLPALCALSDDEVVEQCKTIYREFMNDDPAAWDALGRDYHARLERNYVTWVRHYVNHYREPCSGYEATSLLTSPSARWTGPWADSPLS
jgi:hypothetical protein